MIDPFESAFMRGESAYNSGHERSENPYDPDCDYHESWNRGYDWACVVDGNGTNGD